MPTFSQKGKLHIPAQHLQAYNGATRLEVKLIASRIDSVNRRVTGSCATVLLIDLEQPFDGAEMNVAVPGKGALVVTLQVRMYMDDAVSCNRLYKAADILALIEDRKPGTFKTKTLSRKSHFGSKVPACAASPMANGQALVQRE